MNYTLSLEARAEAEIERRRRRAERLNSENYKACKADPAHFIDEYVYIYDATSEDWVPFKLWDAQRQTLQVLRDNPLTVILKARQLGFSWLVLAFGLWLMLFWPAATFLILSKGDDEAVDLLDFRLKGMYERLPVEFRLFSEPVTTDHKHEWLLSNGSRALAFSSKGGRSYTATFVMVDEADYSPDLKAVINAVKPTIDAGGRLALLSTPDKSKPMSMFKNIYRAAKERLNEYVAVFHGWRARPDRTQEWYERQKKDDLANSGSLDNVHQEYPETDVEALSPNALDKRLTQLWLSQCYSDGAVQPIMQPSGGPDITGLVVYREPHNVARYVLGADPAEGNPSSDDSALTVINKATGEEVAMLAGKFEPTVFGSHIDKVATYFNQAGVLVERNNHGHSVIAWLQEHSKIPVLEGPDGRPGWLSTKTSKIVLYDIATEDFREGATQLHSMSTYMQLASVEAATLKAPEGMMDDRAMSYALALAARTLDPPPSPPPASSSSVPVTQRPGAPFMQRSGNPFRGR